MATGDLMAPPDPPARPESAAPAEPPAAPAESPAAAPAPPMASAEPPPAMPPSDAGRTVVVEIERAPGPGPVVELDDRGHPVVRRFRPGGLWLGFDHGAVLETDDGRGRALAALVAVPASTFPGCRIVGELAGALVAGERVVLLVRLAGAALPPTPTAVAAAALGEAEFVAVEAAARLLQQARARYRERARAGRPTGGRAWAAIGTLPPELARFATPHSPAEYRISQLPPRIVRGLEGALDDDERILAWVRRPGLAEGGLLDALRRGRRDRREAVLLLTDRQLVWVVDHAEPGRYLVEWGVDVEIVPLERLAGVALEPTADGLHIRVETDVADPAGVRTFDLPPEAGAEAEVLAALLERFVPSRAGSSPRRFYELTAIAPDLEPAERFRQGAEAAAFLDRARRRGDLLGFLFSPRRPGAKEPAALAVYADRAIRFGPDRADEVDLAQVAGIGLTLSPLVGRITLLPGPALTYPAPFSGAGAALTRLLRRATANAVGPRSTSPVAGSRPTSPGVPVSGR